MAASLHGDTPYSGKAVTSGSATPYTTSVDVNAPSAGSTERGLVPSTASSRARPPPERGLRRAPASTDRGFLPTVVPGVTVLPAGSRASLVPARAMLDKAWMPRSCCLSAASLSWAGAVERRAEAQEALRSLWHQWCGSHSAWLPRSCRNSCMNYEASTSYVAARRDSSRVSAITEVHWEHTGIRSRPTLCRFGRGWSDVREKPRPWAARAGESDVRRE